jgi:hypothetical protein
MRFEKEALFQQLVSNSGMNLYLGAGFSVYASNRDGESLPLGEEINKQLIDIFEIDKSRKFTLSQTCRKIKKENESTLIRLLKDKYTVHEYDPRYKYITNLPINNIITLNIDNLLEKVFENNKSKAILNDAKINGPIEKKNEINLYKIHGSVTYPIEYQLSFTDKETSDLFIREKKLYETVSYKLSSAPTIFWGVSLRDNNTLDLICDSDAFEKSKTQKWLVVYPHDDNKNIIEDYEEQGFNIIEADTMELLEYLNNFSFINNKGNKSIVDYIEYFPKNFISEKLKKLSVRRPVVDFFAGAEPQISDILSENVARISYFNEALECIIRNKTVLITGIPGCGKSTLLLQLAFSEEITGKKFWFNNITKQEAEKLKELVCNEKQQIYVFIDNISNNMDAFMILRDLKQINLVVAERTLNFDYIKRSFNIDSHEIIDISNLEQEDIRIICKSMNRSSEDAISLLSSNENVSLLEIVFFVATKSLIHERIKAYINDLRSFKDRGLKIQLLELFTLINYTSYCGVPCSMDMLLFYFDDEVDSYNDILYALDKMKKIIVQADSDSDEYNDQDYLVMRSKLFAEKSINLIDSMTMKHVLNRFWDNVNPLLIYRFDVMRRKAYDADITTKIFTIKEGKAFYEKIFAINHTPFVKHQYAIFLSRKKNYDLAWNIIDQAYTESKKKVYTIANTHAVILFEMNIEAEAGDEEETKLLKTTIQNSFNTLEYCINLDVRINYHTLVYARNTIRYYEKYGKDQYFELYANSSLKQLRDILSSTDYIPPRMKRELHDYEKRLKDILQ